jgi:creatinine amidohydrolase
MQLGEQRWPDVAALTTKVAVVPIGSFEQHGRHLPLLTDSLIGQEVARRAEAELGDEAVFLPMLYVGASDHHLAFPGTVSLSLETYTRVLAEIVESLLSAGFRRVFLLNAHAGNAVPAQAALNGVQTRRRAEMPEMYLTFASWFDIAAPAIARLADAEGWSQRKILHACEWETSQIQRLRPDLVRDERPSGRFTIDSDFWWPDHTGASRVFVARGMEQSSRSGAYGFPEHASPAKGEALYSLAAREVVAFVREFARWPVVSEGGPE